MCDYERTKLGPFSILPVIGVAQVANKQNKRAFNSSDIKAFEAFALFCGLGIHNAMLYDKVMKLNLR